jgi:hypothetical protein
MRAEESGWRLSRSQQQALDSYHRGVSFVESHNTYQGYLNKAYPSAKLGRWTAGLLRSVDSLFNPAPGHLTINDATMAMGGFAVAYAARPYVQPRLVQQGSPVHNSYLLANRYDIASTNVTGQLDNAYHYTSSQWAESIQRTGLRQGSYATPNGNLTGLQAQVELSLNPTRAAPNMRIRINVDAMRKAGYDIPTPTRVSNVVTDRVTGRVYTMPGGGYEMKFPYKIPSKYLEVPGQ